MPNYRRAYVPGGTFFVTLVTHCRRKLFHSRTNREHLGTAIREVQTSQPFEVNAIVLLPDHLHAMITLPVGDTNYSIRIGAIKRRFSIAYLHDGGTDHKVSSGARRERRRGVWQRRFWEHTIANESDFETHFDYIHFNPVKHGLVKCPHQWEASTFHRWVKLGVYSADWACGGNQPPKIAPSKHDFGEPMAVEG